MILEQLAAAICDTSQTKPLLIANSENRGQSRPSSLVFSIKNRDWVLKLVKPSKSWSNPLCQQALPRLQDRGFQSSSRAHSQAVLRMSELTTPTRPPFTYTFQAATNHDTRVEGTD